MPAPSRRRGNANANSDASNRRTEFFQVRLTKPERRTLEDRADRAGMKPSAFIRSRIFLDAGDVVKDIRERVKSPREKQRDDILKQLSAIGNNLNQLARVANTTGEVRKAEQLEARIAELGDLMVKLR